MDSEVTKTRKEQVVLAIKHSFCYFTHFSINSRFKNDFSLMCFYFNSDPFSPRTTHLIKYLIPSAV